MGTYASNVWVALLTPALPPLVAAAVDDRTVVEDLPRNRRMVEASLTMDEGSVGSIVAGGASVVVGVDIGGVGWVVVARVGGIVADVAVVVSTLEYVGGVGGVGGVASVEDRSTDFGQPGHSAAGHALHGISGDQDLVL